VDLNADGNIDLLCATYFGLIFVFYGNNDTSLNEAIILKDKSDSLINLGTYYDLKPNQNNIINGIGETVDKALFVKAYDWDNDGDLDLLISGDQGVKLRINEGYKFDSTHIQFVFSYGRKLCANENTALQEPIFRTKNINVVSAHYADAIVDWDSDGLWDIVGGSHKGGVYFYKNIGKLGSPSFGEAKCIIKSDEFVDKTRDGICGITQIAVADYNNDGKLDVIVGNSNSVIKQSKLKVVQKIKEVKAEVNQLNILAGKFLKNNDDKAFDIMDKIADLENKLAKYSAQPLRDKYGYVWVSLRK
jgi:hypothetical protein